MSSMASVYVFLFAAVTVPFVAVRLWRRQRWAVDALQTISSWPITGDGTLSVKLGQAVGSARVLDALGHTSVELRLRFPDAEAAWAALDRVPVASRLLPVAQTERESDTTIVVRFSWETLVVPADVVRSAIAEIAAGGPVVAALRAKPAVDPVFAAVKRVPRAGQALLRLGLVAVFVVMNAGRLENTMFLIVTFGLVWNQLAAALRSGLGLSVTGRFVPFQLRFFGFLTAFAVFAAATKGRQIDNKIVAAIILVYVVLELVRALRAGVVAKRLATARTPWVRAEGTVRDPDRGPEMRPFVLETSAGEYWVEAGPTHTLVGGTVKDGDRVEVVGKVGEMPADSTYRSTSRRLLTGDAQTPLAISVTGSRPARWIAVEAGVALVTAAGYTSLMVSALLH
jgi:hypothetical protein